MPINLILILDLFLQLIANPPTPTVGLAALLAACELGIHAEISVLKNGSSRCLADLQVIENRPPTGILDGVVKTLLHSIRSCSLSTLISIVTDDPLFTLLWHRTAHLLKECEKNCQVNIVRSFLFENLKICRKITRKIFFIILSFTYLTKT